MESEPRGVASPIHEISHRNQAGAQHCQAARLGHGNVQNTVIAAKLWRGCIVILDKKIQRSIAESSCVLCSAEFAARPRRSQSRETHSRYASAREGFQTSHAKGSAVRPGDD